MRESFDACFSGEIYDLGSSLDATICTTGHECTQVISPNITADGLQKMSSIYISPHAVTHVDCEGFLESHLGNMSGSKPQSSESYQARRTQATNGVKSYNCVVVDLADRASRMQEELERAGFKQVPYGKKYVWSEGVFGRLLTAMEIAKAEVEWLQQIDPAAVVFRTGWRRFAPSDGDLRDPSLVPWHPYLMHPYLSSEAADFLVSSMHLRAIGSDHVHGLDSPLRYVFHGTTSPDLSHCRPDVVQALREDAESGKALPDWRIYWHLHTTALGRGLQLLENLYLPLEVLCPTRVEHSTGGVPFRRGRLLVISFSFGGRPDVELVSAFFAPGVWRDGNE